MRKVNEDEDVDKDVEMVGEADESYSMYSLASLETKNIVLSFNVLTRLSLALNP